MVARRKVLWISYDKFLLLNTHFSSLFSLHGDCQTIYNIHPLAKYEAMEIEQELETVEKTRNMHEHLQGDKKLFGFFFSNFNFIFFKIFHFFKVDSPKPELFAKAKNTGKLPKPGTLTTALKGQFSKNGSALNPFVTTPRLTARTSWL